MTTFTAAQAAAAVAVVARTDKGATTNYLAQALHLTFGQADKLTAQLEADGFIMRGPNGRWWPNPAALTAPEAPAEVAAPAATAVPGHDTYADDVVASCSCGWERTYRTAIELNPAWVLKVNRERVAAHLAEVAAPAATVAASVEAPLYLTRAEGECGA